MKKSKKLTILFSIVTISVLVAIGCSNDNSSDEPETTSAAAATEDTQTPAATNPPAQNPPAANPPAETPVSGTEGSEGTEEGNEESGCTCDSDCASTNLCNVASGTCVECLSSDDCGNGFICVNNTCVRAQPACPDGSIDHCRSVSGDNCDVCEACEAGYYLDGNGRCKEIPIYACIDYESGECTRCEAGYYLDNKGRCIAIPIMGCIDYESGECRSCRSGYHLNSDKNKCEID